MSLVEKITADNFDEKALKSELPVLVDFYADWCGPCKALAPTIDAIASEYAGRINVYKLDVQNESKIAARYGILSIPTLLFFKNGNLVDKMVGGQPKANIVNKIESLL